MVSSLTIIGGMSNGAHSIVAMFEQGDAYLMSTFQNLVLIEGGWYAIKTFDRYQGKGIHYLHGDYTGQNDWLGKKMREDLPKAVKKLEDAIAALRDDIALLGRRVSAEARRTDESSQTPRNRPAEPRGPPEDRRPNPPPNPPRRRLSRRAPRRSARTPAG